MVDKQISNYVRQNLRSGYSVESVKQALASKGYDASIVDKVASEMNRGARSMQQPLPVSGGGVLDKIKGNKLVVEIVVLVIVLIIAAYVFLFGV